MSDIAAFLTAQYDRIETAAREATEGPWVAEIHRHRKTREPVLFEVYPVAELESNGYGGVRTAADATHIAIHDPEYILADIASKRRVIDLHRIDGEDGSDPICNVCLYTPPCETVRFLAAPFSGEPGYKQQWAV